MVHVLGVLVLMVSVVIYIPLCALWWLGTLFVVAQAYGRNQRCAIANAFHMVL